MLTRNDQCPICGAERYEGDPCDSPTCARSVEVTPPGWLTVVGWPGVVALVLIAICALVFVLRAVVPGPPPLTPEQQRQRQKWEKTHSNNAM